MAGAACMRSWRGPCGKGCSIVTRPSASSGAKTGRAIACSMRARSSYCGRRRTTIPTTAPFSDCCCCRVAARAKLQSLSWSEVLSDRIVLPAERVKNACENTIPLTPQIQTILEARPRHRDRDFIFGRLAGPFRGWHAAKQALDARIAEIAGEPLKPWVTHDLRRTCSTGMGELTVSPHIIEAALNHRSGFRHGVAARYNYSKLETPVRNALTAWGEHIMAIVEGRTSAGDRVVSLRA